MPQRIVLVKLRKEPSSDVNQELQWLGNSLGLFNLRDRESSCFRVFITLVKKRQEPLSSDEIAERLQLSRGTVVHHLNKLIDSGIVLREREGYALREANLHNIVRDIQREMEDLFKELQDVAKDIDEKLG